MRGAFKDLTGESKYSLTIIGLTDKDTKLNRLMWKVLCKCGNETKVSTGDWNSNRAKTCGCSKFRKGKDNPLWKHGAKKTAEEEYIYKIKKMYGIDYELYQLMNNMQDGKCAICNNPPNIKTRIKRLVVDHCHDTNRIRGLLCNSCNRGIGLLRDNSNILNKAFNYIKRNEVNHVFA